jgi:hypothetical protein
MASILSRKDVQIEIGGFFAKSAAEFGSGAGIGFVYAKYSHTKVGKHVPALAAIVGKLLFAVTKAVTYKHGGVGSDMLAGAFDSFGGAGLALAGAHYVGLDLGRKSAGYLVGRAKTLPSGVDPVRGIGALPAAPEGEGLSWPQLMALSEMH